MKVKLTLNIKPEYIKAIKSYAKAEGISVSGFLENRIDLIPGIPSYMTSVSGAVEISRKEINQKGSKEK